MDQNIDTWNHVVGHNVILERLPQHVNLRKDITNYGVDNLYPQRMEQVSLRSPITLSAMRVQANFVRGDGFINGGDIIINRYGETLNEILRSVTDSQSMNNGYGLHFNVNTLGLITEITAVPFKNIRYGLPDSRGIHDNVKLSNNWEHNTNKFVKKDQVIETFPLWDYRDMDSITDIEDFEGFVNYKVTRRDNYPLATFDSVIESVQSNGEIQVFELAGIQSGFLGASLFKLPNEIETEEERRQITNDLRNLTGPHNANSVMIVENVEEGSSLIEQIPANNNDRLFELTNETTQNRIISNYATPHVLLGIQPNGGMFNQEQLRDSYVYMNTMTRDKRLDLVSDFNKFMDFWHEGSINVQGIKETDFEIKTDIEIQVDTI